MPKQKLNYYIFCSVVVLGNVRMIEADILMGTLESDDTVILPIMAHPPHTTSDLSLETFLRCILAHNDEHTNNVKGVKLDFKSIESFDGSLNLLKSLWHLVIYLFVLVICCNEIKTSFDKIYCQISHISYLLHINRLQMKYPVWINADILSGPVHNVVTKPVDADRFLNGCTQLTRATISPGWTTLWGINYRNGNYTREQINEMIDAFNRNEMNCNKHPITFPVRAGIAAQSEDTLIDLLQRINKHRNESNTVTLTIWSNPNDYVDVTRLRQLIVTIGYDRVYVDVPTDLMEQLQL